MPQSIAQTPPNAATRAEWICLAGLLAMIALAALLPAMRQPAGYHAFADARSFAAIPNAWNVLSNLAFIAAAAAILLGLPRSPARDLPRATRNALFVTGIGLIFTAAGSAYYHADPGDEPLLWDRLPMTIVFAGIAGGVLAQRVTPRAGTWAAIVLLLIGPSSLIYWRSTGNLMPYIVLQGALMAGLLLIVLSTPRGDDPLPWWWVIVWYGIAKVAELFDVAIFDVTGGVVSGHTLKHLLAAVAAGALAYPLWRRAAR
jgi:multisubunit Na+/H+ antiporter MnhB subunit